MFEINFNFTAWGVLDVSLLIIYTVLISLGIDYLIFDLGISAAYLTENLRLFNLASVKKNA